MAAVQGPTHLEMPFSKVLWCQELADTNTNPHFPAHSTTPSRKNPEPQTGRTLRGLGQNFSEQGRGNDCSPGMLAMPGNNFGCHNLGGGATGI